MNMRIPHLSLSKSRLTVIFIVGGIFLFVFILWLYINNTETQPRSRRVDMAISDLKDPDAGVRINAAEFLVEMWEMGKGAKEAVPALITSLKDPDREVRLNAAEALGKAGKEAKEAVPTLISLLKDPDREVRLNAAEALGKMGREAKEAVPTLISLLNDLDWEVRSHVVNALGEMGKESEEVATALITSLKDPDREVRLNAVGALGKVDKESEEVVSALISFLNNSDKNLRLKAADTLGKGGVRFKTSVPAAVPALISLLKDPDARVRSNAAEALGELEGEAKTAVPALIASLKDSNAIVYFFKLRALFHIGAGAKEAVAPLIALLKDPDARVRSHTAEALGKAGKEAKEAVAPLIALLKDPDREVRLNAAEALGKMGKESEEVATVLSPFAGHPLERKYKGDEAISVLIARLKDPDREMRISALKALSSREAYKESVAPLIALFKDPDREVRRRAIEALEGIEEEAKEAVPALIALLKDPDREVRFNAAEALGKVGREAKEAVAPLIALLKEPGKVRHSAAEALGQFADTFFDSKQTEILPQLKLAYEEMRDDSSVEKDARRVKRTIEYFESLWWVRLRQRAKQLTGDHYIIAGAIVAYLLFQGFCGLLLWIWPLRLLPFNLWLDKHFFIKPKHSEKTYLMSTLVFPWFAYRPRLLDAWIKQHLVEAGNRFTSEATVKQHPVYVPMPLLLDTNDCESLTATQLHPVFEKPKATVLLTGEGGAGKTNLACQIGLWAMEENREQQLCKDHPMIPILIEGNLKARDDKKNPFFIALRKSLSDLTDDTEPILDELVNQLLKKSRVLVIVDSFSELDEATQNSIRQAQDDFLVGALIVTTRNKEETLGGDAKTVIEPQRLKGKVLASFLQNYLCQRLGRELSEQEDLELFAGCKRLSELIGEREITVLIAKMYAEQMLAAKLKLEDEDQPRNLPELMKGYITTLNNKVKLNPFDMDRVQDIAKLIAWECLRHKLHPSFASKKDVRIALKDEANADALLDYLEDSVPLVQTKGVGADQLKFFLDPLAEYLAAFYLVERFPDDKLWNDVLTRAKADTAGASHSFMAAILDCCTEMQRDEKPVPERITRSLQAIVAGKQAAPVQA